MPCIPIRCGKLTGVVCGFHPMYDFGGFLFEVHSYFGPHPLSRKDRSTPLTNIPDSFWQMWERWEKVKNKEDYRVE